MFETGGDDYDVQEIVEAPKTMEAETDATASTVVLAAPGLMPLLPNKREKSFLVVYD
jgi:hypothetical protein